VLHELRLLAELPLPLVVVVVVVLVLVLVLRHDARCRSH